MEAKSTIILVILKLNRCNDSLLIPDRMNSKHPKLFSGFLIVAVFISCGHIAYEPFTYQPPFSSVDRQWADTTLSRLTLDEKIGQLFILTTTATNAPEKIKQLTIDYQPSGVLLDGFETLVYRKTIQKLRNSSIVPLLELSDETTAVNNQFSDLPDYPDNATLSALGKDFSYPSLQRKLIADFQKTGINCSLSPNIQALAEHPTAYHPQQQPQNDLELISRAATRIEALQARKILAIANDFDFYVDSIPETALIESGVFNQYKPLIISGLSGVLLGEDVFAGDSITHRLPEFYKTFLQKYLQFEGLIFGEISSKVTLEELLYAGASTFLVKEEALAYNINHLKELVAEGIINEAIIDAKVHQLLLAKKWLGLDKKQTYQTINTNQSRLVRSHSEKAYTRELFEASIILANNPDSLLPFTNIHAKQYKVVNVGQNKLRAFQNHFFNYAHASNHLYRPKKNGKINALAFNPIRNGALVVTLDHINLSLPLHEEFINSINTLNQSSKVVVVNFGNPLNFSYLDSTITAIQIFERNDITETLAPQLLFGAITAQGKLPIEVASWMPKGTQIKTSITRLKYTIPEEVGIPAEKLSRIDDIFASAIRRKATPGGQVLIAKQGKIIYAKNFGHHTYEASQIVEKTDLYDVASVTKTAATTLAAMHLYEQESISLDEPIRNQMTLPKDAGVRNILLKDLFIHKSGLQRNMPIATYLNNRGYSKGCTPYFCNVPTDRHTLKVAENFYFNEKYLKEIYLEVSNLSRDYRSRRYLYSDVNFYLIQQLLEEKIAMDMDDYLKAHFYQPLGLRFLSYKPLERFSADVIVPTQQDRFWRKGLVRGYVHDEAAAILGGVGGNAGLFANAEDLAVLFQMLLNGGQYGGQQFLQPATIDYFTASIHGNHRGLGFDKARYNYTASKSASRKTYGHSGFSGTCVWVDPDEELIYVFLSNRIHPDPKSDVLKKMRVRQKIHQVIYDALESSRSASMTIQMAGE